LHDDSFAADQKTRVANVAGAASLEVTAKGMPLADRVARWLDRR
jgi:hypothetical protein